MFSMEFGSYITLSLRFPLFDGFRSCPEGFGRVPGRLEQVPGLPLRAIGGVGLPTSDFDLRFPMIWWHLLIWAYVFPCFWAIRRSRPTFPHRNRKKPSKAGLKNMGILWCLGLWREPLKEGNQY